MDHSLRRMIAHHDSWAATYDQDIAGMVIYNRITWDNILRFLPEDRDGEILDAGGGTGFWAIRVAELGYRVTLVDLSPGMLDKARDNVAARGLADQIEIGPADIRSMPQFEDNRFSMVVSEGDPVSYCGDHKAAIRELARVVRPGGAVVVSVDSRAACLRWLSDAGSVEPVEEFLSTGNVVLHPELDGGYVAHAFTPEELAEMFESHGLSVERIIGKPVIVNRLALGKSDDPAALERLYLLESRHCDDPAFYPWAGHLEIAGRKR